MTGAAPLSTSIRWTSFRFSVGIAGLKAPPQGISSITRRKASNSCNPQKVDTAPRLSRARCPIRRCLFSARTRVSSSQRELRGSAFALGPGKLLPRRHLARSRGCNPCSAFSKLRCFYKPDSRLSPASKFKGVAESGVTRLYGNHSVEPPSLDRTRLSSAEDQLGVGCILLPVRAELLDDAAHLRVIENTDFSQGQRHGVLEREVFDLAGKQDGARDVCASGNDPVIGQETRLPILQGGQRGIRKLLRTECVIWGAADVAPARNRHHVMECWNAPAGAGERGRSWRMSVDDRAHIVPRVEYVAVEPPFARGATAAEPTSIEVHERNIRGLQHLVIHPGRAHEEPPLIAAHADIARGAMRQTSTRQLTTGRNHHRAQVRAAGAGTGFRHCAARSSGYSRCNPARLAEQMPRSVISAVTSRAGVTSKARFSAVLPSGTSLTVSIRPEELRPVMCVTSSGDRSSIGTADPACSDQSIVLAGSAA